MDFRVDRFVVRNGRLAARGTATARLSGPGSPRRTVRERVTAPARIAQQGRRRCSLISLSLAPLQLDLLGLRVETSTINLRIRGVRRGSGSGVLGAFCARSPGQPRQRAAGGCASRGARSQRRTATSRAADGPRRRDAATPGGDERHQGSCQVLFPQLGPLELNVLGLLVELFGENDASRSRSRSPACADMASWATSSARSPGEWCRCPRRDAHAVGQVWTGSFECMCSR
jgi:hypothetical protein